MPQKHGLRGIMEKVAQKRMLAVLIAALFLVFSLLLVMRIQAQDIEIGGETFTYSSADSAYLVDTAEKLKALGQGTAAETEEKTFLLQGDLTVAVTKAAAGVFAGTFDGGGHTITYEDISIKSKDASDTKTVTEGVLFGALTGKVVNLFLNVSDTDASYSYHDTAETAPGTEASYTDGTFPAAAAVGTGNYTDETLFSFLQSQKYELKAGKTEVKKSNLQESSEETVTEDTESYTKDYYYLDVVSPTSNPQKASVTYSRSQKTVDFGIICGTTAGTLSNVKITGNPVTAETVASKEITQRNFTYTDDSTYRKTYIYKQTVTYKRNYVQDSTGSGTKIAVTQKDTEAEASTETETPTEVYKYLYATKNGTDFDLNLPLYQQKSGAFDLTAPIYKTVTVGGVVQYDLTKYANGSATGLTGNSLIKDSGASLVKTVYRKTEYVMNYFKLAAYDTGDITTPSFSQTDETGYLQSNLSAGTAAGAQTGGSISGVAQDIALSVSESKDGSDTKDIADSRYLYAGGIVGNIPTGASSPSVADCYIVQKPAISAKSGASAVTGVMFGKTDAAVKVSAAVIDNREESYTVKDLSGAGGSKITVSNCYAGKLDSAASVQVLSSFDSSAMKNWILFDTDVTGKTADVYALSWLCKTGTKAAFEFDYTMPDETVLGTIKLKADGQETPMTYTAISYTYRPDKTMAEQEKIGTDTGEHETASYLQANINFTLGESGFFYLNHAYAENEQYYFYSEEKTASYQYPFLTGSGEETLTPEFGTAFFRDHTTETDSVIVSGQFNQYASVKFAYTFGGTAFPVISDAGSSVNDGTLITATVAAAVFNADTNRWEVQVAFPETLGTGSIRGYWVIQDSADGKEKYYPIRESGVYSSENREAVASVGKLSAVSYYDKSGNAQYEETSLNTDTGAAATELSVYGEQKLKIPEYSTAATTNNCTYMYVFTKTKQDLVGANIEDILKEQGVLYKETQQDGTTVSNMSIPKTYKSGDKAYLYIIKSKNYLKGGITEVVLNVGNASNVEPSIASGGEVCSGAQLSLSISANAAGGTLSSGMNSIRYLKSFTKLSGLSSLVQGNVSSVVYDAANPIRLTKSASETKIYVYVQEYATLSNNEEICGNVMELEYNFMERGSAPESSLTSGSCENGDIAYLTAKGSSVIVYRTSQDSSEELEAEVVTNQTTLGVLSGISGNTTEQGGLLYVKSNDIWYVLTKGAKVYDSKTGITLSNTTQAVLPCSISTIAFYEGKDVSSTAQYDYSVATLETASEPTAVLPTTSEKPEEVTLNTYLFFQSATPDAELYYTTDSTTPGIKEGGSTKKYDEQTGIQVKGEYGALFKVLIVAVKYDSNGKVAKAKSSTSAFVYKISAQKQAVAPTSTPATTEGSPTVLTPGEKILLSTTTKGASIYYTTDGTDPAVKVSGSDSSEKITVTNGTLYDPTKGIVMPEDGSGFFTIRAVAVKKQMSVSEVTELIFSYPDKVSSPYASPASGTVSIGTTVSLGNSTEGATIYYEIAYDGKIPKNPTLASSVYDSAQPFTITRKTTIKAFAVKDGVKSSIAAFTYNAAEKLGDVTPSIASGTTVARGTKLTLSSPEGGTVYYTTDGSDPSDTTNTTTVQGTSLLLDGSYGELITVKAYAVKSGSSNSGVSTFTYVISKYQGGITSDTQSGSELSNGTVVNLTTDIVGAAVYYTTDGTTPTTGSTKGTAVTISGVAGTIVTVKAIAVPSESDSGTSGSTSGIFTYKIKAGISAPSASPAGGVLTAAATVTLSGTGNIYYTTDGSIPTTASALYKEPIEVKKAMTIKAISVSTDGDSSSVASFVFTAASKAAAPKASKDSGVIEPGTTVYFTTATQGALIYYSTDGTEPTVNNLDSLFQYTEEGITVNRTIDVKAAAYLDGMLLSSVSEYEYQVDTIPAVVAQEQEKAEAEATELKKSDTTGLADKREADQHEGTSFTDIVLQESEYQTVVSANQGVVPDDTVLTTYQADAEENAQENLKEILGDTYTILTVYNMKIYSREESVQPDGEVEIGIPIPKGQENAAVTILYIDEDGSVQLLDTRRSGNMAYAFTDHFSMYALAGVKTEETRSVAPDLIQVVELLAGAVLIVGLLFLSLQFGKKRMIRHRTTRTSEEKKKRKW